MTFLKKVFHFFQRQLAHFWRLFFPKIKIIGVTGSYGKTNTTRSIAAVLKNQYSVLTTDIDLDSNYNLPLTLLKIRPDIKVLVLEYGVDHRGEMERHLKLVRPTIGILTGITPVHSDEELLGSKEGIMKEKGKLLESLPKSGWAILNFDDPNVKKMAHQTKAKIITYGRQPEYDYWADKIKVDQKGTSFLLHYNELGKEKTIKVRIGLIGEHFVQEALAAIAVGKILGISPKRGAQMLKKLQPLSGRMSLEKGPRQTTLLNDSLRANPASTRAGLITFAQLKSKGKKIAVLGEMGELGIYEKEEHLKIGSLLGQLKKEIDEVITIGPATKFIIKEAIKAGFPSKHLFWTPHPQAAGKLLKKMLEKGDFWYLKGSRLKHLERIIMILEGERIDCQRPSCHYYWHCRQCPKRYTKKD